MLIEVCCGSVDDAICSQEAGAQRVELNSSMFLGGITPSLGALIEAKQSLHIPVVAMIRPRNGGFCYTDSEFKVMQHDAKAFIDAGADGIIFGILEPDGGIDRRRNRILAELGQKAGIDVAFHRAFDVVPDWRAALEELIALGIQRILTTGQRARIEDGAHTVRQIVQQADGRIEILPGGMRPDNICPLSTYMGTNQAHIASFTAQRDTSCQHNQELYFGGALYPPEMRFDTIDPGFIAATLAELKNLQKD